MHVVFFFSHFGGKEGGGGNRTPKPSNIHDIFFFYKIAFYIKLNSTYLMTYKAIFREKEGIQEKKRSFLRRITKYILFIGVT